MNEPVRITPAKMIFLGLGWFGAQFFWGFHTGSMPLFLEGFTDSKFMISLVLSMAGVTGCVVPFVVGFLSDRTVTRFGRRRPYVFAGMLGVLVSVLAMSHLKTYGGVAIAASAMYFFIGFAQAPYLSLLPDVTPEEQRSAASGVMYLLGGIGLVLYFVISSGIWDNHRAAVFRLVALVPFIATLVTVTLIREPQASRKPPSKSNGLAGYLGGIARETNVMKFFIAQTFWWFGIWMTSAFLTLFIVEDLGAAEGTSLLVMMAFSLVATFSMLPLGMLGNRVGRKNILTCTLAFWALAMIAIVFLHSFTAGAILIAVTGIPFAAVMGTGYTYTLDLVPPDRVAEFMGISSIGICTAQIFGPMLGGKLIDSYGYRSIFPCAASFMLIGLVLLQLTRSRAQSKVHVADDRRI